MDARNQWSAFSRENYHAISIAISLFLWWTNLMPVPTHSAQHAPGVYYCIQMLHCMLLHLAVYFKSHFQCTTMKLLYILNIFVRKLLGLCVSLKYYCGVCHVKNVVLTPFHSNKIFVHTSLSGSTTDIYFEFKDKEALNQTLQYMRKKSLIDWHVNNWWRLWWQANSNLDSNDGLRISCTNDQMNNQDEDWVKFEWVSFGRKWLIYELELVRGTILINVN